MTTLLRHPLPDAAPASPEVLAEILDGGQSFRWRAAPDGSWSGVFGNTLARVRAEHDGCLSFYAAADTAPAALDATRAALTHYLGDAASLAADTDALPWRSDPQLHTAMRAFPGLRLLRQPFGDALVAFICSANANIPRIRAMVASLAERFGPRLAPGVYGAPDWRRLARATDADLAPCKLGYRADYLRDTARRLADDPGFEARLRSLPHDAARDALRTLPGVGPKVADCVRLFSLGHSESFPVDTWIRRVMTGRYALDGWTDAQLVHFARIHYGAHAGLAQQFLFAHARRSP